MKPHDFIDWERVNHALWLAAWGVAAVLAVLVAMLLLAHGHSIHSPHPPTTALTRPTPRE